jgi:hypothetical protein
MSLSPRSILANAEAVIFISLATFDCVSPFAALKILICVPKFFKNVFMLQI